MREGLALREDSGVRYIQPYCRSLMAEGHLGSGQSAEALATFDTALSETQETEEFWFQAELYRGRGELFLTQPDLDEHEAEACFGKAIEIACAQSAKSLELRAATSLARLWQRQGKNVEARNFLAQIYDQFTEGFDTADLKMAKALLDDLA